MTQDQLDNMFTYHPPRGNQPERYRKIREAGKALAQTIIDCTPVCPDQTVAIRKVREAIMTANAAIAINEVGAYTLEALLAQVTEENRHPELPL